MQCALFGKLPSKRDFVSYNMPRPFLENWENWLQASLAESKLLIGDRWQNLFLTMPIWRFWLGRNLFGQSAVGAIMPSVDGVGRYFPLCLVAFAPETMRLVPPPQGDLNAWLASGEVLLLNLLNDDASLDAPTLLRDFPFPPTVQAALNGRPQSRMVNWTAASQTLQDGFAAIEAQDAARLNDNRGFWWTLGGNAHAERLVTTDGPPGSGFLANMMTATFD